VKILKEKDTRTQVKKSLKQSIAKVKKGASGLNIKVSRKIKYFFGGGGEEVGNVDRPLSGRGNGMMEKRI
jgi:hypothetical protein